MKLVVDTSIIIDTLRGRNEWEQLIHKSNSEHELFIPTVVIIELYSGKSTRNLQMVRTMEAIFHYFTKIVLSESIARRAGELYRDSTAKISLGDYIIAATALELGAKVVTLNRKHFTQIPGLQLFDPI